jgi:NADH-quinone oxidoreductase subunit N
MFEFQLADIPRILPEILLLVLAVMILGSDIAEKWGTSPEEHEERTRSSGSLAVLGLGLIFIIVLVQSGFIYRLPADAPPAGNAVANFFLNILRNLQFEGVTEGPILGAFATDNLTMIGRLTFIGAAFLTCLMTLGAPPADNPGEFYTLIVISTAGTCLMAGASELIIAFLAIELTSIPLYVLAGYFRRHTEQA